MTEPERQLQKALRKIEQTVKDGLRYGNSSMSITIKTVQHGTRRLTLQYGREQRFDIPEEEANQTE